MGHSNGKITAPISITDDIPVVLGIGSYDVGAQCASANINKWSRKKPIVYPKMEELTDAQFKGTAGDNINGIYYGLKSVSVAGNMPTLHNSDFIYYRPTGGDNAPYRVTDFGGYDHYAKPTLNGMFDLVNGVVNYYNNGKINAIIEYDYNHTNKTGVDIGEFLPTNESLDIGDYYPGVLVDNYAICLTNSRTGTITPLRYNSAWYTGFGAAVNIAALQVDKVRKCTLFLIKKYYQQGLLDLSKWTDVSNLASPFNIYAVPNGVAKQIQFKYVLPVARLMVASIPANVLRTNFFINLKFENNQTPSANTNYDVVVQIYELGGTFVGQHTYPYNYVVGLASLAQITVVFSHFGIINQGGEKYRVVATTKYGTTQLHALEQNVTVG